MNTTLTYGLIGCGSFGNEHMKAMLMLPGVKVTALCDIHIERCYEMNERYGLDAKCYENYNDMLAEQKFDIVVVAAVDKAHAGATVAALRAGSHVLCEKPMSLFLEDCKEMIQTADETGKLLMVGQVCRFTPGFVQAKEIVDAGVIGELYFIESEYAHDYVNLPGTDGWRTDPDREPIIGGACHAIDLVRWIAGDPIETMAYTNHKVLTHWPVNDTTISIMKFPNDVIGKVFASIGCKRDYTMRTVIYGTKGTIIVDNTTPYLTLMLERSADDAHFANGFFGTGSERSIRHQIDVSLNNHNVAAEHKALREAILEGKPLLMTGREGAKTVAVCRAVVEAANTGKAVKVDYNF